MKRFVVLVALLVSSGYASAGRTLTLEECRELAIQNNKELKISGEKIFLNYRRPERICGTRKISTS